MFKDTIKVSMTLNGLSNRITINSQFVNEIPCTDLFWSVKVLPDNKVATNLGLFIQLHGNQNITASYTCSIDGTDIKSNRNFCCPLLGLIFSVWAK